MTKEAYPESARCVFGYAITNIDEALFRHPDEIALQAAKQNIERAIARLDEGLHLDARTAEEGDNWRQTYPDIFPEMDWSDRNPDGTRKYPDKPEYETDFEEDQAIAYLLRNDITFMRPEDGRYRHLVNINDIFAWGYAETEEVGPDDLLELTRTVFRYPTWGSAIFAMTKRRQMPQAPVAEQMIKDGIKLDQIREDQKLRPNLYDNSWRISNEMEHEIYLAWCKEQGKEPCNSWHKDPDKDKIPGMRTPEYYERFRKRRYEWAISVGYEVEEAGL